MSLPTYQGAWLVKGEVEIGPQRRCRDCTEWWPLAPIFWVGRTDRTSRRTGRPRKDEVRVMVSRRYWLQPCIACRVEQGMATG